MTKAPIVLATTLALLATGAPPAAGEPGGTVPFPIAGGTALLDPANLAVTARTGGRTLQLSAGAAEPLGPVAPVSVRRGVAEWSYPDRGLTATASARDGRLVVRLHAETGTVSWPVTAADRDTRAIQFPRGEGLSVPVADPFWNSPKAGLTEIELKDLTMPFWGTTFGGRGASYLVPTDLGTTLRFTSAGGRLRATAAHTFSEAKDTGDYTVTFALTGGSPVDPALDYRRWLAAHGRLGNLDRKIRANPEVGKLIGAFHAYLWGDGRSPEGIRDLSELGLSRMWLGYDADGAPMSPEAVRAATEAGYLVAPYDTWDNAQDPATADTPASVWPAPVWPKGCVHDANGKPVTGFGGRGCYLSSQALAEAPHLLAERVDRTAPNGVNSYFLDVDATGELFHDYSPAHPMTMAQDRRNRLHRMRGLSAGRRLVLGSETAGSWANQVLAFSHGSSTPVTNGLWKAERDRETWGGYWPKERPAFFFRPVELDPDVARAMFDPAYRVPLYETALHDSVVSTARWELPLGKLPAQRTTRILLAMLYNTPLNFALDRTALAEHGERIAELQRFFAALQRAAATLPMTGFRWLTEDHLVQQTNFGDALRVTANFGTTPHDGLPGGCVQADLPGGPRRLCV